MRVTFPVAPVSRPAAPTNTRPTPSRSSSARLSTPTNGRPSVKLLLLLGTMLVIGPATIDMYLPALPRITAEFGATEAAVQLTLAGTMVGMALGQLVIGPLSDSLGRRRPLLIGVSAHVIASLAILLAPNVETLGILRVLQGFGAAASATIGMAVVRDLFSGVRAAQVLSRLMLVMGLAPILAPSIGSAVLTVSGWRTIFVVLALISAFVIAGTARFLPETLPPHRRRAASPRALVGTVGELLRDRVYVGLIFVQGLTFAALFTYVSGSSFVLQGSFGLSEQQFGLAFSAGAVGMIVMTQVNVPLLRRFAPGTMLITGVVGCFGSALLLVITSLTAFGGLFGVLVPIWLTMSFLALTFPNTPAIALSRHGDAAGTAAALMGASQNLVAALAAPLVGLVGSATALPMGVIMASFFGLAALVLVVGVTPRGLILPVDDEHMSSAPMAVMH
jgi:MFS transporter, DHA1 family, multidrug resistance protein